MDDAGLNQALGDCIDLCRCILQNMVDRNRCVAQLFGKLGQVLFHYLVPGNAEGRRGAVERLLDLGRCILNSVVDLGSQLGQPVLDPRRDLLHAVGEVVCGRLQSLLDLGGSGVNAVLDSRNSPVDSCLYTWRCPVAGVIHAGHNCVLKVAGNTV